MNRQPFPVRSLCVVAATLLALALVMGCHSFFGGTGGGPTPPPPGGHGSPPPSPSQHALSLAIYGGLAMAFAGVILAACGRITTGLALIPAGIGTWALANFLRQYETAITIAAGVVALAAIGWAAWEGWKHRKALAETVASFNAVKLNAPDLWNQVKAQLPEKSATAEAVVKALGA